MVEWKDKLIKFKQVASWT